MTDLIFPYTNLDNPVIDKALSFTDDISLISLDKSSVNINGLYTEIYRLDDNLTDNIRGLEKFYLEKRVYDRNFDFSNFISKGERNEMPEMILRELNRESLCNGKNNEKIILSSLFLKLFEKYESDKKNIDTSFASIQKREQELFNSLTNEKPEVFENPEKTPEIFPRNLIEKRIKSWFDLYFFLGLSIPCLITDKNDYMELLCEMGFELENETLDQHGMTTCFFSADLGFVGVKDFKKKFELKIIP